MMSSSPSDLSFLSVLSSTPSNDMGLDTTYSFSPDTDFGDLMMSPFMKHSQDFHVNMNSMLTSTTLPTSMPVVNLPPLSPESDNGSFADSVMSSSSSQPTTTSTSSSQQQRSSIISDNEYHSPHDEPLSPLPDDYFTNMAQLQAQAQQQAQQQVQQQQQQTTLQQQQQGKPVVSILHTTPPTTPTEKPTLLNHLSVSITPSVTTPSTSTPTDTKPTKKRKSRTVKVEPTTPEDTPDDDDIDIAIDPNLPPDVIRELLQEQSLKKKRLARKAELARMSRKRKKTRMGDLELECERLHAEIDRLRKMRRLDMEDAANKQQQAVAAATASAQAAAATNNNQHQHHQMIKEEDGKFIFDSRRWIDVSDHQKAVADTIQAMADAARTVQGQEDTTYMGKLHETFVQTFNRQMVAGEGHITALENHLSPCMPLQFLQWVMSQPDKFCQDNSGLWNSLFQAEIGVTTDQMKEIMALRTTVKKQRKVNVDVEKAYKKLSHCLRRQMSQSNENLTKLRSILSPLQLAKYFDWVNRFGHVCVKINL